MRSSEGSREPSASHWSIPFSRKPIRCSIDKSKHFPPSSSPSPSSFSSSSVSANSSVRAEENGAHWGKRGFVKENAESRSRPLVSQLKESPYLNTLRAANRSYLYCGEGSGVMTSGSEVKKTKTRTKTKKRKEAAAAAAAASVSMQQLPPRNSEQNNTIEAPTKPVLKRPSTAPLGGRRRTSLYRTQEESSQRSLLSGMSSSFASDVPRLVDFHRYVPSPFSSASSVGKAPLDEDEEEAVEEKPREAPEALLGIANLPDLSVEKPSLPTVDFEVDRVPICGNGLFTWR